MGLCIAGKFPGEAAGPGTHSEKQGPWQTYTCQTLTITAQEVENQIKKVKNSRENQRNLYDVNFRSMEQELSTTSIY